MIGKLMLSLICPPAGVVLGPLMIIEAIGSLISTIYHTVVYGSLALKVLQLAGVPAQIKANIKKGEPIEPQHLEQYLFPGIKSFDLTQEQKDAATFFSNSLLNLQKDQFETLNQIKSLYADLQRSPNDANLKKNLANALNHLNEINQAFNQDSSQLEESKQVQNVEFVKIKALIDVDNLQNVSLSDFEATLAELIPQEDDNNDEKVLNRLNKKITNLEQYKEKYDTATEITGDNDPIGQYFNLISSKHYNSESDKLKKREEAFINQCPEEFRREARDFFREANDELNIKLQHERGAFSKAGDFFAKGLDLMFGVNDYNSGHVKHASNLRLWLNLRVIMAEQNYKNNQLIIKPYDQIRHHYHDFYQEGEKEDQPWYRDGLLTSLLKQESELESLIDRFEKHEKSQQELEVKACKIEECFAGYEVKFLNFDAWFQRNAFDSDHRQNVERLKPGKIYITRKSEYGKGVYRYKFIDRNNHIREGTVNFRHDMDIHSNDGDDQNKNGAQLQRIKINMLRKIFEKERRLDISRSEKNYRLTYHTTKAYESKTYPDKMIIGRIYIKKAKSAQGKNTYDYKFIDQQGRLKSGQATLSKDIIDNTGKLKTKPANDIKIILDDAQAKPAVQSVAGPLVKEHFLPKLPEISGQKKPSLAYRIRSAIRAQFKNDTLWQRLNNWGASVEYFFAKKFSKNSENVKLKTTRIAQTRDAFSGQNAEADIEHCFDERKQTQEKAEKVMQQAKADLVICKERITEVKVLQDKTRETNQAIVRYATSVAKKANNTNRNYQLIDSDKNSMSKVVEKINKNAQSTKEQYACLLAEQETLQKETHELIVQLANEYGVEPGEEKSGSTMPSSHDVDGILKKTNAIIDQLDSLCDDMPELKADIQSIREQSNKAIHDKANYPAFISNSLAADIQALYSKVTNEFSNVKDRLISNVKKEDINIELDNISAEAQNLLSESELKAFTLEETSGPLSIVEQIAKKIERKIEQFKSEDGGAEKLKEAEALLEKITRFEAKLKLVDESLAKKQSDIASIKGSIEQFDENAFQQSFEQLINEANAVVNSTLKENLNAYVDNCIKEANTLESELKVTSTNLYAMTDEEHQKLEKAISELQQSFDKKCQDIDNAIKKAKENDIEEFNVDSDIPNFKSMKKFAIKEYHVFRNDKKSELTKRLDELKNEMVDLSTALKRKVSSTSDLTAAENEEIRVLLDKLKQVRSNFESINEKIKVIQKESEGNQKALQDRKAQIETNLTKCDEYHQKIEEFVTYATSDKAEYDCVNNNLKVNDEQRKAVLNQTDIVREQIEAQIASNEPESSESEDQGYELTEMNIDSVSDDESVIQEIKSEETPKVSPFKVSGNLESLEKLLNVLDDGKLVYRKLDKFNPYRNAHSVRESEGRAKSCMDRILKIQDQLLENSESQRIIFKDASELLDNGKWNQFNQQFELSNRVDANQHALVCEAQWNLLQLRVERLRLAREYLYARMYDFSTTYKSYLQYASNPEVMVIYAQDEKFKAALNSLKSDLTYYKNLMSSEEIFALKHELETLRDEAIADNFDNFLSEKLPVLCLTAMNENGIRGVEHCHTLLEEIEIYEIEPERLTKIIDELNPSASNTQQLEQTLLQNQAQAVLDKYRDLSDYQDCFDTDDTDLKLEISSLEMQVLLSELMTIDSLKDIYDAETLVLIEIERCIEANIEKIK